MEAGSPTERRPSRARVLAIGVGACLMAIAVSVGAVQWWQAESARSDRLEIVGIEVLTGTPRTRIPPPGQVVGSPADGWPSEWSRALTLPAVALRVTVNGDPQRSRIVEDVADSSGALVTRIDKGPASVPAGQSATVDLVVASQDCGRAGGPILVSDGDPLPLNGQSRALLEEALARVCATGGPRPALQLASVRTDAFLRDRAVVGTIRADPDVEARVLVLVPLDGPGLRGVGSAALDPGRSGEMPTVRWLISAGQPAEQTARVRAYRIVGSTAYAWMLDLDVPDQRWGESTQAP